MSTGKLKADFAGGRVEHEFVECCRLCLPAKSPDTSIVQAAHAAFLLGRARESSSGGCLDRLIGYGVEPAQSEQRRRISL